MSALHEELHRIVLKHGISLMLDPKLCEATLNELIPNKHEECNVLVQGVIAGIPLNLLGRKKLSRLSSKQRALFKSRQQRKWAEDTWAYAIIGKHRIWSQFGTVGTYISVIGEHKRILLLTGILSAMALLAIVAFSFMPNLSPEKNPSATVASTTVPPQSLFTESELDSRAEKLTEKEVTLSIQETMLTMIEIGQNSLAIFRKQQEVGSLTQLSKLSSDAFYQKQKYTITSQLDTLEKNLDQLSIQYNNKLERICYIKETYIDQVLHSISTTYSQSTGIEKAAYDLFAKHISACTAAGALPKITPQSLKDDYTTAFHLETPADANKNPSRP